MSLTFQPNAAPQMKVQPTQNLPHELSSLAIFGEEQFKHNAALHEQIGSGVVVPKPEKLDATLGVSTLEFLAARKVNGAEDQLHISHIVGEETLGISALADMCARRGEAVHDIGNVLGAYGPDVHNNHAPEWAHARAWVLLRDGAKDSAAFVSDSARVQMARLADEAPDGVKLTIPTLADVLVADLIRMEAGQPLVGAQSDYAYRLGAYPELNSVHFMPQTEVDGNRRIISSAFHAEMGRAGLYRSVEVALL